MNMEERLFVKNFPPGMEIPPALVKLFRYQASGKYKYSGHFYLYDRFWQKEWILEQQVRSDFVQFGFDADGSVYALWIYYPFALDSAPVVFLGSEWAGNKILANSIREFLALLSLGIPELGYAVEHQGWEKEASERPETIDFRKWLARELDIQMPKDPLAIVETARARHPDLNRWLQDRTGLPPG